MESRRSAVAYEPMCISSYHFNRRRDTVLLGMELKLQQLRRSLSIIFNRGLQQQNCRKHRRSRAGEVCIYVKACGTRVEACGTHVKGTHVRGASYRFTTTCDNTSYTHTWRLSRRGSSSYLSDEFCSSFRDLVVIAYVLARGYKQRKYSEKLEELAWKWEDNFGGALSRAVVKWAQESLNVETCRIESVFFPKWFCLCVYSLIQATQVIWRNQFLLFLLSGEFICW